VAQVVEHLLSQCETQGLNSSTAKKGEGANLDKNISDSRGDQE
jgi:hypothetical protein